MKLTDVEKQKIIELISAGQTLPSVYRNRLFNPDNSEFVEATADYRLIYKGKVRKEDVIARTPVAPFQKIRSFNSDNPFHDEWQNLLIFGDNLLALKTLYDDQQGPDIHKTRNRIKLIYIDPPFATRQDFMKDREKAYRDKIIGAQFIEFLRKRLILLREILADDGFIFVHLDFKMGHYIKAIMDEVFDETNFRNEIILPRPFTKNLQQQFKEISSLNVRHDTLLFYSKRNEHGFPPLWVNKSQIKHPEGHWHHFWSNADRHTMRYELFGITPTTGQWIWKKSKALEAIENYNKYLEEGGDRSLVQYWIDTGKKFRFIRKDEKGNPQSWRPPADQQLADSLWLNLMTYENQKVYPTQKHEDLLHRLINSFSNDNDIVLDAFAGSGTTIAVAEKLGRRWIGIDCGKLAIYTIQKRLLNLTTKIGSGVNDERREYERVPDFEAHSKSNSRLLFMVYEKAKKGDLLITDLFLQKLAELIETNLRGSKTEMVSLICPENKFRISNLNVVDNEDGKAGEKIITIGRVRFLISFVQAKEKREKDQPLAAKEFALLHAGVYDKAQMMNLPWNQYQPFVSQLFGMRDEPHKIYGFQAHGYIGVYSAFIWNYPDQKNMVLDRDYVQSLHDVLNGRAGSRFYVIAPVVAMHFMEDEITIGDTTYVFLKVPLSVLKTIIERGETGSLKQPTKEENVNDVIDAVGFDFISQPVVAASFYRKPSERAGLFDSDRMDFVIEIKTFKSNTLVYDPDDFENFETLSMILIDSYYNDQFFNLTHVFWADTILNPDRSSGIITISESDFQAEKMMIILMDRYGNELKLVKSRKEFHEPEISE